MTEKEFNLSQKLFGFSNTEACLKSNIKEFIKKLKEAFKKGEENYPIEFPSIVLDYSKIIDKLAGSKLSQSCCGGLFTLDCVKTAT